MAHVDLDLDQLEYDVAVIGQVADALRSIEGGDTPFETKQALMRDVLERARAELPIP